GNMTRSHPNSGYYKWQQHLLKVEIWEEMLKLESANEPNWCTIAMRVAQAEAAIRREEFDNYVKETIAYQNKLDFENYMAEKASDLEYAGTPGMVIKDGKPMAKEDAERELEY